MVPWLEHNYIKKYGLGHFFSWFFVVSCITFSASWQWLITPVLSTYKAVRTRDHITCLWYHVLKVCNIISSDALCSFSGMRPIRCPCKFSEAKRSICTSVTSKKSPNVYKSCPKNDFTRKMIDFDTFTKMA